MDEVVGVDVRVWPATKDLPERRRSIGDSGEGVRRTADCAHLRSGEGGKH
jgi:hypothetical protein